MDRASPLRLGVLGAGGRMGSALLALAAARSDVNIAARLGRSGPPTAQQAIDGCQVIVDFSSPEAAVSLASLAAQAGDLALVIGSTGFSPAQDEVIARAAERIAIVKSGNFSLGVNLLLALAKAAARRLPAGEWDVEINEAHHRRKVDAPSGTALMLGEAVAGARGESLADLAVRSRDGATGPRPAGAIGFSSIRAGDLIGEHAVIFAADDEVVTLAHSARDRRLFARGALAAALWVVDKPAGLYDMQDVLALKGD